MKRVEITSHGIKKQLDKYRPEQALAEYIWNGFDAGASEVRVFVEPNEIGGIATLEIFDNGHGIPRDRLDIKFTPLFDSEKVVDPQVRKKTSSVHGEKGVGRLTFFKFAQRAKWDTVFENGRRLRYQITVDADELNTYNPEETIETSDLPGTLVQFTGFHTVTYDWFVTSAVEYLMKDFAWFLELNAERNYAIWINDDPLNYASIIGDTESFHHTHEETKTRFEILYIQWNVNINNEYSRYYYIGSDNIERGKLTTTLNNKGDKFYHSVYIRSRFFDDEHIYEVEAPTENGITQLPLFGLRKETAFKELMQVVDNFLRSKRKPFLRQYTDKVIQDLENDKAFPRVSNNEWDRVRHGQLETFVRELYQVEPKIFLKLNSEQKRVFIHLLDLVMDSNEREHLFNILQQIIDIDPEERQKLADLLKVSHLSNVIQTIKLIEDRYKAIYDLKELVFNRDLDADEPHHIQKMIEKHYWIFGEQYHLVTAAEPDFEEALRRHIHILRGENKPRSIDHPDKHKEMDIFAVRQLLQNDSIDNIVVELKNPKVRLSEKELSQVKRYMRVIRSEPEFNAYGNVTWKFYLVGNEFDSSDAITLEMESAKPHGKKFLVQKAENYEIYVMKWSEVFADFELRHKFLYDKLLLERDKLASDSESASAIIQRQHRSHAVQPSEISIPKS